MAGFFLCRRLATFILFAVFMLLIMNFSDNVRDRRKYRSTENVDLQQLLRLSDAQAYQDNMLSDLDMHRITTEYHCEAIELGCFTLVDSVKAEKTTFRYMTIEWCLAYCSYRNKMHYAGLMDSETCLCSRSSSIYKDIADIACKGPCLGDRNCIMNVFGSENTVSLYKVYPSCIKGLMVPEDFDKSRYFGCFKSNPNFLQLGNFSKANVNSTLCILYCGMQKEPMAFMKAGTYCSCGRVTTKLPESLKSNNCSDADDHMQAYNTLVEDTRCSKTRFLPVGTYHKTVLLSVPGSGNTWTRFLLEKATGVYTGSIYTDVDLDGLGFLGEMRKDQAVVIKDHMYKADRMEKYGSAILVIRNPYEALIANFHRLRSGSHTGHADEVDFKSQKFLDYMDQRKSAAYVWLLIVKYVIHSKKPFLLVYFDDLVKNPVLETKRMVEFIIEHTELKVDNLDQRLICLTQYTAGRAKRKSKKLAFDPFTNDVKLNLNEQIRQVREMLLENGVNKTLPTYEKEIMWE